MEIEFITKTSLKDREWTDGLIKQFLPEPDKRKQNPCYRNAADMCLYKLSRVEIIESSEEFSAAKNRLKNRINASKKAAETKREKLLEEVESWEIVVEEKSMETIMNEAMEHYMDRCSESNLENPNFDIGNIDFSNKEFMHRIAVNYIRHELSMYDDRLENLFGKVGKDDAYLLLNEKIYEAIAEAYPDLGNECQRQLERKEMMAYQ